MDYNGMTEEEYLDSLLRQASDDIPKENMAEREISEPEVSESEEQEAVFDFDDIFGALAEVENTSAESVSEEATEDTPIIEELMEESIEEPIEEPVIKDTVTEEIRTEEIAAEEIATEDSVTEEADFLEDLFAQMESEMENVSLDEAQEVSAAEELFPVETEEIPEPEDNQDFTDFHRSLDSIIGELEQDRDNSEDDEIDIFSQIDNAEVSEEEMSQEIDDMSLLEAVGMLLDEEDKANEKQEFSDLFDFDTEIPEKLEEEPVQKKVKEEKPKKEFFKKFKNFLVEQGEDTEEDIAAEEAAALAKEEKAKQAEEDKEKKAEEKAAKKEQAEQAKAAKKAAREGKALERQMKKEQKKAEEEASGEPKYNVTIVKLSLLFTIVAASGILLWAISSFNFRRISKKESMIYFTADQYELAYEKIAGLEPRKSERVFFEQVRTVMYVQKQYDSYLSYYNIGMKEEALDSLLKGIDKYDKYYETADDLGILDDMNNVLDKIYTALEETYNLLPEKANEIANIEDSADYSVELRKVINSIKE